MVLHTGSLTLAEFMALPEDGYRHEFVRGDVRVMPPPKSRHGLVETKLLAAIDRYLDDRARSLGWRPEQGSDACHALVGFVAGGEFGMQFTLPDDPDQVRGADGAYVPAEQLAASGWSWHDDTYFPAVAHLVIEVISLSESAADSAEKVQDYLAGGARHVWCVYPERRVIHIHDADAPTRVLRWGDTLTDDALLPGFALPFNLIFPQPRSAHGDQ